MITLPCGAKVPRERYEDCVLKELILEISDGGNYKKFDLTAQRRHEAVDAKVFDDYVEPLKRHDLVIEALSSVDLGRRGTHLRTRAMAINSSVHHTFQPPHPETRIGSAATTNGGKPASADLRVPERSGLQSWLSIWPFRAERQREHVVSGQACGHTVIGSNVAPAPALGQLDMLLIVMPEEEWSFQIKGIKGKGSTFPKLDSKSGSKSTERLQIKRAGDRESGGWGAKSVTTTIERAGASISTKTSTGRDFKSENRTETDKDGASHSTTVTTGRDYHQESINYTDKDGAGTTYSETTNKGDYSETTTLTQADEGPIGSRTFSVSQTESTKDGVKPISAKTRYKASEMFSLQVKSAGETATFQPSVWVDRFYEAGEILKDMAKLLSSFKAGVSYGYDYKMFEGDLSASWGYRWPADYKEESRVYYVERFVTLAGDITLIEGSLSLFVGLDFDKGWLPAGVRAIVELSITMGLHLAPQCKLTYTNYKTAQPTDVSYQTDLDLSITPKAKGNGTARVFGYRRELNFELAGIFKAAASLTVSMAAPPSLKASVGLDKGICITGYFYNSSKVPPREDIEPIELVKPCMILKEREFWS
ncbi:hypothetical protein SAMN05192580_3741 [Sphingomonas jatrophae]|uniref:Uncharacterized protein n=2 Tax=Sphingomonas jatrophae TaxID=1166337 RepID=A0A1I6MA51_9SPHN|nr:hypothetical protein SAMN05192580_3741 [Sphingomonas jatrophae]